MPSSSRFTAPLALFAAVAVTAITVHALGAQATAATVHGPAHAAPVAAGSTHGTVDPTDLTWG